MEEFVYIDGKKYRRGYTTGSTAAGASKAATYMLLTKSKINSIKIDTPKGIELDLAVENANIEDNFAECSIKKDGGDDIDATHTMDIFSKSEVVDRLSEDEPIIICGGKGIGVVTKKGLSVSVGKPAINPIPLKMILSEVGKVISEFEEGTLSKSKAIKLTISAPQGEEIAKKTFNPRLGIIGGISILGTTGIVEPMSDEGWKKSLSIELQMKKEQGMDKVIFVPGNHGEQFISEYHKLSSNYVIRTSNFIGYMLKEAQRMGFKKILMAGHIGKFIKLSAGIFNTHSKIADARNEILISNLALMGAPYSLLKQIDNCVTSEEAIDIISEENFSEVFNIICNKCKSRVLQYLNDEENNIDVEVVIFSMDKTLLGKSSEAEKLAEVFI
nr:cobalt-precorrin-5B (C(1))-methyltransferase CbiD [Clostridioides sp.]